MVWDAVDEGIFLFGGVGQGPVAGVEPFWDYRDDLHLSLAGIGDLGLNSEKERKRRKLP